MKRSMEPYRITQATLVTYSGKRHSIQVVTEPMACPLREAKEKLLDMFCSMCSHRSDPFVKIEVKTVPLFN